MTKPTLQKQRDNKESSDDENDDDENDPDGESNKDTEKKRETGNNQKRTKMNTSQNRSL
jgi:hypothetical protein